MSIRNPNSCPNANDGVFNKALTKRLGPDQWSAFLLGTGPGTDWEGTPRPPPPPSVRGGDGAGAWGAAGDLEAEVRVRDVPRPQAPPPPGEAGGGGLDATLQENLFMKIQSM